MAHEKIETKSLKRNALADASAYPIEFFHI